MRAASGPGRLRQAGAATINGRLPPAPVARGAARALRAASGYRKITGFVRHAILFPH